MRKAEKGVRKLLGNDPRDRILVIRHQIAIEKTDRDRLDTVRLECADGSPHRFSIEREMHHTGRQYPLADLEALAPSHQRHRLIDLQIVQIRP